MLINARQVILRTASGLLSRCLDPSAKWTIEGIECDICDVDPRLIIPPDEHDKYPGLSVPSRASFKDFGKYQGDIRREWERRNIAFRANCLTEEGLPFQYSVEPDYVVLEDESGMPTGLTAILVQSISGLISRSRAEKIGKTAAAVLERLTHVLNTRHWNANEVHLIDLFGYSPRKISPDRASPVGVWRLALELYFEGDPTRSKHPEVRNCLDYYSLISEMDNNALKVVLAMSGLEAILGIGRSPKTDTISRRSAYLLAPEPGVRAEWRKRFAALYDRRSEIVHGGGTTASADEGSSSVAWLEEAARAMFHYLEFQRAMGTNTRDLPKLSRIGRQMDDDFDNGRSVDSGFVPRPDLAEVIGIAIPG